jgi:hypothetical protein
MLISALGTMQAIAGARHDTSSKSNTPNWRKRRIRKIRLRLIRSKEQSLPALLAVKFEMHSVENMP